MPYYQCPRCGGTDSYGQWEQRFTNRNITIRDNRNQPIGSTSGMGVSNVRQQYCHSCISVKMDLKFTTQDLKIAGYALLGLFGLGILLSVPDWIRSLAGYGTPSYEDISLNISDQYAIAGSLIYLFLCGSIVLLRKLWINNEARKTAKNKFYVPRPPGSSKFLLVWFTALFFIINFFYLIQN